RTPLNGIIGFTDLLLKSSLHGQQRDHLHTIRKSSEILLTIINDILDFSKIEAGKLVLDRIPFRLRDIIEDVMTMLAPAAHAKNLDLVPLIYNDVPDNLMGDPLRIKQVITNLLNNAIKFTQTGEVVLRAMLDEESDAQHRVVVRFSVTDTGVGLSRAQQQSLFNAFSQADASTARQFGGTGLGLMISRRLVEEMGGQIGLESELGKGSAFWFTLNTEVALNALPAANTTGLRGERVIYCETQRTTGLAVEHMLRDWQVDVTRAASPGELVQRVSEAQVARQGYAVAILGLSRHMLNSGQYRDAVQQLELQLDCRTLLLTPTLDEAPSPLLPIASAHVTKPVCRSRLYDILIRLAHGEGGAAVILADQQPNPAAQDAHPTPRILAVDDNDANLKLVLALLALLDVRAEGASSGFEALSKLRQERFDLIFMDVQMPGMDGLETTTRIREQERPGERVAIIALTAHALQEERERLLRSGFDDYLTKPVSEAQLAEVITRRTGYPVAPPPSPVTDTQPALQRRPSTRERSLSCVDVEAGIRLAAGKRDLAEELFSMLIEHLEADLEALQQLHAQDEYDALLERVHKLHGATRYCGVPELRQRIAELETALKQGQSDIEASLTAVLSAIREILLWCQHTEWQPMFRSTPVPH
ncbi:MAG: response regulator, partial [Gammaproteobacteria bacterium]|nr:response regulator [Gammaproteobacteria bacterium]